MATFDTAQAEFDRDYRFYQQQLVERQEAHDDYCEVYGFDRQDLAHAAASERQNRRLRMRNSPSWATQVARYQEEKALKAYSAAIGGS